MSNLDTIKQKMHEVNNEWIRVRNEMYNLRKQEINSLDHDTKGRAVLDYDTFFTGDLPENEHPLKSMQKAFWQEVSSELFWKVYDRFCDTIRDQVQGRVASVAGPEVQN